MPQCIKVILYSALALLALDTPQRMCSDPINGAIGSTIIDEQSKWVSNLKKIQSAAFGLKEYKMKWEGTFRPRVSPEHLGKLRKKKQEGNILKMILE